MLKYAINSILYTATFRIEDTRVFKEISSCGYDGIEICLRDKNDFDTSLVLDKLKESNLKCTSICGVFLPERDIRGPNKEYIKKGLEHIRDCIDTAAALECNIVIGPVYSAVRRAKLENEEAKREQWKTVVENLREVCKYAEEKNVFIAIEPINRFETDFLNLAEDAVKIVEEVGSTMLKINLDTFHMHIEEKDSYKAIKAVGRLLYVLHASENDRGQPGTGQVHWDKISRALKEINYDKNIVVEAFTPFVSELAEPEGIWRNTESISDITSGSIVFLKRIMS